MLIVNGADCEVRPALSRRVRSRLVPEKLRQTLHNTFNERAGSLTNREVDFCPNKRSSLLSPEILKGGIIGCGTRMDAMK